MSNHEHVVEELSAYLDEELDSAAKARIESHVRSCAPCAQRYRELRSVTTQMRSLRGPEVRPEFVTRVLARVRDEQAAAAPWWQRMLTDFAWRREGALAGAVFACALGVLGVVIYGASREAEVSPMATQTASTYAEPSAVDFVDELIDVGVDSAALAEYAEPEESAELEEEGEGDPMADALIDTAFLAMLDAGWEQAEDDVYSAIDEMSAGEQAELQLLLHGGYSDTAQF